MPVQRQSTFHQRTQYDWINNGGHTYKNTTHQNIIMHYLEFIFWTALLLCHRLFLLPFDVSVSFSSHLHGDEKLTYKMSTYIIHLSFYLLKKTVGISINYRLGCNNIHVSSCIQTSDLDSNCHSSKWQPQTNNIRHKRPLYQYPHRRHTNSHWTLLLKNNNTQITQQIITLIKVVLSQNYFTFQNKIYQPQKGEAKGSPISSTITEIFLQYLEDTHIKQLIDSKNIIFYTRYADNILIIYNTTRTTPDLINTFINQVHTAIQLNPTYENNCISFPDLLIIRKTSCLETDIRRKLTTTDTTINFSSNHPTEHKMAAYLYHITRIHSLPLTQ